MKRKTIIIISILIVLLLALTGCNGNVKLAEVKAQEAADIIVSGDMEKINQIIFGHQNIEMDESVENILEDEKTEENGILNEVFKRCTIEIEKVTRKQIKFQINSPDLSNLVDDSKEEMGSFSEEEILKYFKSYISEAELKTHNVAVPYTVEDDEVKINYKNKEFINAITGGFLESYQGAFQEMIDVYAGIEKEN